MAKEASSIQEFLIDAKIGISADRRHIIDFVLDNYVPKEIADLEKQQAFLLALERVMTTLSRLCYRQTGKSDMGDTLNAELRAELKGDFAAEPPPFFV